MPNKCLRVRFFACLIFSLFLGGVLGAPANAHPLGNFTINHLAKIQASAQRLRVHYVLDLAEIPTFQIMHQRAPAGNWTPKVMQAWADSEVSLVQTGLQIASDGEALQLHSLGAKARTRPGAGGLALLYWVGDFTADLGQPAKRAISISDHVYEDRRIGWKDIVILPQSEPTHELLMYPSALLGSPRTITRASFKISSLGKISAIQSDSATVQQQQSTSSIVSQTLLSQMFLRTDQGPLWILITILAAFGFGALHAIEPGHGKALLAFTLVGARATTRQATILAASLTFAHTIGVILLGVVLFFVTGFVPETIYPWITLASGVAIAIIGGRALARYIRGVRPFSHAHVHEHEHAHPHEHPHMHAHGVARSHAHGHDHNHPVADNQALTHTHSGTAHSHLVPGHQPLNFGSAIWAALSGGIAPCPAAIILLIAAVNSHRIGYGLLLIVIFGLGLASVLTGLGLAVVHGAAWISSNAKYERIVRFGPVASGLLISIIGSVLLGQGFVQIGVHTSALLVSALALAAIAGYAFSANHTHRTVAQAA
ncbi:MAG: hypothetical protein DLM53_01135 [Candidatus Eremiobacter antarcticus]|nr:MAG: hypothetical protein DLM50_07150 [Candidatus Eremiobacteraeota bacterium]PZR64350.1 MAG: hypothetical protein DLM53_01135 [Candidatus Eremiobacter sp. RRmetagenome_bin22]